LVTNLNDKAKARHSKQLDYFEKPKWKNCGKLATPYGNFLEDRLPNEA